MVENLVLDLLGTFNPVTPRVVMVRRKFYLTPRRFLSSKYELLKLC